MEKVQSPDLSSQEEYDDETAISPQEGQWQRNPDHALPSPSVDCTATSSTQPPKASLPMQKRRRVTRACDECRRKKIKCDGKQPCTHCTVYSYDCTYDQPSNRRRNPAPQYIEALENRLQRAEALLKTVLPDLDLDDPNYEAAISQRIHPVVKQEIKPADNSQAMPGITPGIPQADSPSDTDAEKDSLLESMVENTGLLDIDDQGYWDFHGHSSGLVFLQRMREQFGGLMGKTEGASMPFMKSRSPMSLSQPFESPKSLVDSPMDPNLPNMQELPARDCARKLCEYALDDACALMRFVHQPTFYAMFDRVYDVAPENYGNDENRFLPLLYSALALGCLFAKSETSILQIEGYESAMDQGFNYFRVSRSLIDVTDCRDLTALQTILFMIIFLQSSARLSTCFSHIGIVLRSALRMGLHRTVPIAFTPVELETRKRIFWVVRKMDTYVGALLGLPKMLSDGDIDQEMPVEVDDEYITVNKIIPMPVGKLSLMTAFNFHTQLVHILAKTVKYIYPIKAREHSPIKSNPTYAVSHAKIREIEHDLQQWLEGLPMALRPGGEASPEIARIQQLLRMAYAHIQMFLYRPFLHYVSPTVKAKSADKRSYACAAACVSVSRNIVHITGEMKKRGLLTGAYWFYMYTTFFAILSLVFFVLENPQSPTSKDILRDAHEGKDTLASLAQRSMAADRCSKSLATLFEQLPEKLKSVQGASTTPKKRPASSRQPAATLQPARSAPEATLRSSADSNVDSHPKRASTSPHPGTPTTWKRSSIPYESTSLRQQVVDTSFRRSSHDTYSPTTTQSSGIPTPDSPSGHMPSSATQPGFPMPPNMVGSGFFDLSSMMFSSTDPFAYPNQPMTALENRQFHKQEYPYNPNVYNRPSNPTNSPPFENLDAQLFGPIPMYMMQCHTTRSEVPNMSVPMDISEGASTLAMSDGDSPWAQSQGRQEVVTPGMNLDHIFGEDWSVGWMDQGYRQ